MQAFAPSPYVLGRPGLVVAGRYQLVSPLGQGAMGEVWSAVHTSLGTMMAVKLVAARAGDEESGARFSQEARAAASLKSRHVVGVFDHGSEGALHYLVMELLEGETLGERLTRLGRLAEPDAARIIQEMARGVGRAHQLGVVHRDLKPANVFLARSDDGEVAKILDFGIAKLASTHGGFQTRSGESMGTPAYMSPEQVMGTEVDHRSDLWQVAIVAFECLTGKLPYVASTTGELLSQIATRRLRAPTDLLPQLPRAVDIWFARATALDKNKRYDSAERLAEAFARSLGAPSQIVLPKGSTATKKQQQLLVAVVAGLGCLAVGLLIFVGIAVSRMGKPGPSPSATIARVSEGSGSALAVTATAPSVTQSNPPSPPGSASSSARAPIASATVAPSASAAKPPRRGADPWGF